MADIGVAVTEHVYLDAIPPQTGTVYLRSPDGEMMRLKTTNGEVVIDAALWQPVYGCDDGLVGYWPLSENTGTKAYDRSPYGNDGAITVGSGGWTSGKYGRAFSFDGSATYVDAGNDASLQMSTALTIEAWIYPRSTVGYQKQIAKGKAWDKGWWIQKDQNTSNFGFDFVGPSVTFSSTRTALDQNAWTHFVVTYKEGTVKIYKNGVLVVSQTNAPTSIQGTNVYNLELGRESGDSYHFNGILDEVRIYNRDLSADEVQAHYLRGVHAHGVIVADKFRIIGTDADTLLSLTRDGGYGKLSVKGNRFYAPNIVGGDRFWFAINGIAEPTNLVLGLYCAADGSTKLIETRAKRFYALDVLAGDRFWFAVNGIAEPTNLVLGLYSSGDGLTKFAEILGNLTVTGNVQAANNIKVWESNWEFFNAWDDRWINHTLGTPYAKGIIVLCGASANPSEVSVAGPSVAHWHNWAKQGDPALKGDDIGAFVRVTATQVYVRAGDKVGWHSGAWQNSGWYKIIAWA